MMFASICNEDRVRLLQPTRSDAKQQTANKFLICSSFVTRRVVVFDMKGRIYAAVEAPVLSHIARGSSTLPSHKCLIAMRAYSFLFTLDIPEILFPFKKISAYLTTPSTHGKKQEASEKHYPKYACDS